MSDGLKRNVVCDRWTDQKGLAGSIKVPILKTMVLGTGIPAHPKRSVTPPALYPFSMVLF